MAELVKKSQQLEVILAIIIIVTSTIVIQTLPNTKGELATTIITTIITIPKG